MTPAPLQVGQAPSELALNSAGFTLLAFANALRIGSSRPVYVAGLLRREPRIAAWSIDTTPAPAGIDPCTSELLPEPATPVTTTSTPSGMSTSTFCRLCAVAPRISSVPVGVRTVSLRAARSSRWRPVMVPLARVGMQTRGRLVEDVGDVGERGAEVADHLGALGLAARQRARRPLEREVAQPDLHERVEGF